MSSILTTNSSGSWFSFITTTIEGVIMEEGNHSLKLHFDDDTPVNISSLQFEKVGDILRAQAGYFGIDNFTASKNAEKYLKLLARKMLNMALFYTQFFTRKFLVLIF